MQIRVGRVSPYARQRLLAALENPAESTVQGESIRQHLGKRFGSSGCVAQCFRRGQHTLAAHLFPAFAALLEQQAAQFAAERLQFGPVARAIYKSQCMEEYLRVADRSQRSSDVANGEILPIILDCAEGRPQQAQGSPRTLQFLANAVNGLVRDDLTSESAFRVVELPDERVSYDVQRNIRRRRASA